MLIAQKKKLIASYKKLRYCPSKNSTNLIINVNYDLNFRILQILKLYRIFMFWEYSLKIKEKNFELFWNL